MSVAFVTGSAMASLQGTAKLGLRRFGVPPGGPFDRESAMLANALVGNPLDAAVWEWALVAPVIEASEGGLIATVGSTADVLEPLSANQRLDLAAPAKCRAYLAFRPDLKTAQNSKLRLADEPISQSFGPLRILPGPQQDIFDAAGFASALFRVDLASDRKGIRLILVAGEPPAVEEEIASEPACFGAIQVTPDGTPLILGPDGPTLGGYPKIGVVCEADLDRLAQLRPNDEVRFEWISPDVARELRVRRSEILRRRLAGLASRLGSS